MLDVGFPEALEFLFQPARFKIAHGGRDGSKSWNFARALLELGRKRKLLIVCTRELRTSISESVHRVLENQIENLQFQDFYRVEKGRIVGRNGTEFIFAALKHNVSAIKSLEGADIVWVEEAANVSKDSWDKLINTIRKDGSEIWISFNPELDTDETYKRFVLNPPPGSVVVEILFSDNPWASEVLRAGREALALSDPDGYQHIWLGKPRRMLEGAIYANELRLCESQGRIGNYPYNPELPVDTGWDLGDSDLCAIWFLQRSMGQYRVIDYEEDSHKPLSHYLSVMEAKGYRYGTDYFPWDASSKMLVGSLEETMRQRGRRVVVMPRQPRAAGVDAVREMLGTCWFNVDTCADGLNRLRYYRQAPTSIIDPVTGTPTMSMQPVHDANSHGADGFRTIAMGYKRPQKLVGESKPVTPRRSIPPPTAWS